MTEPREAAIREARRRARELGRSVNVYADGSYSTFMFSAGSGPNGWPLVCSVEPEH